MNTGAPGCYGADPMAEFVLKLKDITEGGLDFTSPIRRAWLDDVLGDAEDLRAGPDDGRLELTARRTGADVVVTGRARAALLTTCGRCLEDARVDADTEIGLLLSPRGKAHRAPPDEVELTPEEIQRDFFDGDDIVLDDVVREQLILEVPMQPRCREDCPGPADYEHREPPSSADDDVDPRLAPLRAFKRDP